MTTSGSDALHRLRMGNQLFFDPPPSAPLTDASSPTFTDLSDGQSPFAAVLACSDSRVPVEAIFSQGAGDLFVIRVAGNIIGPTQLGSLEFAVGELNVPLVLVMGHTGCGAIKAALESPEEEHREKGDEVGNMGSLLTPILDVLRRKAGSRLARGTLSPDDAVRLNVQGVCEGLTAQSAALSSRVTEGRLLVVGSIYELETGRVEFLGR